MSKEIEEWKPIIGYEGLYEVSDLGNVRSVERIITVYSKLTNTIFERIMESKIKNKHYDKDGYEIVNLKHNGLHKTEKVHRLVAKAFIPNPENKPVIDHINGIRDDNRVENLHWVTQSENLNTPLAKANISYAAKINASKRNRNSLGQFTSN